MARDYLASAGAQAAALLTATASTILITRFLGPTGRGEYALLTGSVQLSTLIGQFGFQAGAIYFGSKGLIPPAVMDRAARSLAILSGTAMTLVVAAAFMLYPPLTGLAGPVPLTVAACLVPLLLLGQLRAAVLLGLRRIVAFNRLFVLQQLLQVCGLLVLLPVWRASAAALVAYLISVMVWQRQIGAALRADMPATPAIGWQVPALRQILTFGVRFWSGAVLVLLNQRLSLFIVSIHLDTAAVGLFSVATVMAESLWQFATSVGQVNLSRVASTTAERELPERVGQSCRMAVALTMVGSLALGTLAPLFIGLLFGARFLPAVTPLRILLPGTAFFSISLLLGNDLVARGHPARTSLGAAISVAASMLLYGLLVPRWGLNGAALAGSLSYLIAAITMAILHHQTTGLALRHFVLAGPADFVAGSVAVWNTVANLRRRRTPVPAEGSTGAPQTDGKESP